MSYQRVSFPLGCHVVDTALDIDALWVLLEFDNWLVGDKFNPQLTFAFFFLYMLTNSILLPGSCLDQLLSHLAADYCLVSFPV